MARRITQKDLKHDEFVEGVVGMEQWVEDNWRIVATWAAIAVVLAVSILGWLSWRQSKLEKAGDLVARGISEYQQVELGGFTDMAGLSTALGSFDEAIRKAGGTQPGRVAQYYRGATLYRMSRYDEARTSLEEVVSGAAAGDTLGTSARMMLARVHVAMGSTDEAIAALESIASAEDPSVPVAQALLEIGRIQQSSGQEEEARRTWQRILDEHPQSVAAFDARQLVR